MSKFCVKCGAELPEKALFCKKCGAKIGEIKADESKKEELNDEEFIITPTGLAYDLTKPEDLAIVKIADCSYDKEKRKPTAQQSVIAPIVLKNGLIFVSPLNLLNICLLFCGGFDLRYIGGFNFVAVNAPCKPIFTVNSYSAVFFACRHNGFGFFANVFCIDT